MRILWFVPFERSELQGRNVNCLQGLPRRELPRMQRGLPERRRLKDVKKVIAVSSAKGGVGKSTVAGDYDPM